MTVGMPPTINIWYATEMARQVAVRGRKKKDEEKEMEEKKEEVALHGVS